MNTRPTDLLVFNIERIQNFHMKNLCGRSLYWPGSDSFLSAERFKIDPALAETNIYNKTNITLSSGLYENMK